MSVCEQRASAGRGCGPRDSLESHYFCDEKKRRTSLRRRGVNIPMGVVLLQSVRLAILVVELRVGFLVVVHELLNDGVPRQRTVQLVGYVT